MRDVENWVCTKTIPHTRLTSVNSLTFARHRHTTPGLWGPSGSVLGPLLFVLYWVVQWSWFAWVNALCNLSHKKLWEVTASLPGWFLSRCCFTLWVEPRTVKQYKCHHSCSCKNYLGKGMEGGKKCLRCFWLSRRSQVHEENAVWGIL